MGIFTSSVTYRQLERNSCSLEKESEWAWAWAGEERVGGGRERIPSRLLSERGARVGLHVTILRSCPELKSRLSHLTNWATQAPLKFICFLYLFLKIVFLSPPSLTIFLILLAGRILEFFYSSCLSPAWKKKVSPLFLYLRPWQRGLTQLPGTIGFGTMLVIL